MKKMMVVALAAVSCVVGSNAAMAAFVTDYYNGVLLGSWNQSLTPTPVAFTLGRDTTIPIFNGTGAAFGYDSGMYYNLHEFGGLLVGDPLLSPINTGGPQSYTGPENAPVFVPGVYVEDDGSILTISVPEPATWAMMLAGLGMIGFAARRRRSISVSYA